jgi:hypothetical protein
MDAFADQETRGCLDRRHGRQHHPDIGHRRARVFPPLELGLGGDKHRETRRGIHCIGGGGRVPGWVAISFSLSETYLDILHQEFKMSFNFPPIK